MRLLELEQQIVGACTTAADLEITEIAKRLRRKTHVVRHAVSRLLERGVLRPLWVIDSFRLGWSRYNAFISLGLKTKRERAAVVQFLRTHPAVGFFAESGADYDYEISIFGRDPSAPVRIFDSVTERFGPCVLSKTVCIRTQISFYSRKYLAAMKPIAPPLVLRQTADVIQIDTLDTTILQILSAHPGWSRRDIAREIGVSPATIDGRIQRLRSQGVLAGKIFAVTNSLYGASSYLLLLFARGFDPRLRARIQQYAESHPHCTHYVEGFGSWDYEVGVEVLTHSQLVSIREEISERFSAELIGIRTVPRLGVLRYESLPPLSETAGTKAALSRYPG